MKRFLLPLLLTLLAHPTFAQKITDLPASSGLTADDLTNVVNDPGGSPQGQKATAAQIAAFVLGSDSTLSGFLALTPSNDDVLQRKAGAWINRSLAQLRTDLGLVIGTNVQAWDADLDTWAGKTAPAGTVVGTSDSQTLTNKSISGAQISSAVATATALAANGSNCTVGNYPLGVDASGNVESCTALGAGGDASTNTASSVDSEVALFSGTGGKTLKRATATGLAKLTAGVLSAASAGTDYVAPAGNVATATALAANGANCSTGQYAQGVDASGVAEGCAVPAGASLEALLGTTIITPTDTGKLNNWNPSGLATAYEIRWQGTGSTGIISMAGCTVNGRTVTIRNSTSDYFLWLENQNPAATGTPFMLPKRLPAFLMPGDRLALICSTTSSTWSVKDWPMMGPAMGLTLFEDLISPPGGLTTNTSGTAAAALQAAGGGVDTTNRYVGSGAIGTGTTTTGRSTFGTTTTAAIVPTLGAALSVERVKAATAPDGTETYALISGFMDSAGGTWTDGVGWELRWTGAAAEWSQTRVAGGVATRSNTSSPSVAATALWLLVFVNPGWTRADFIYSTDSVNFVLADSPTTGMPGVTQFTGWGASMIKSAGSTARTAEFDFAGYRVDQSR